MSDYPPPPFLPSPAALSAWGFDLPDAECTSAEDADEILLDLLLYAQTRGGRPWRIEAEFCADGPERFRIQNLRVEFDAHRQCCAPRGALMVIEHVLTSGLGLFWLELPGISAFCRTREEALSAIDAAVPHVPQTMHHFLARADRLALEVYLWQCIQNSGSDKVREAAVRRKMQLLGFFPVA